MTQKFLSILNLISLFITGLMKDLALGAQGQEHEDPDLWASRLRENDPS